MPTVMVVLNLEFIAGVVVGILGLLAWGIITDRPFATYLSQRAVARAGRVPDRRRVPREASGYRGPNRRRVPREASGYRGPNRRVIDLST
jgi:hypothetical protein